MEKKLRLMGLFIFLLTGLSTSSFFLSEYLTKRIIKNEFNTSQLSFAIKQHNLAALNYAFKQSTFHSPQWLSLAKALAKTQGKSAYQLADYYKREPTKYLFWLKNASRLGYHRGTLALARHYYNNNDFTKAKEKIALLSSNKINNSEDLNFSALMLKVHMAIVEGELAIVDNLIKHHYQLLQSHKEGQRLLADINVYNIVPPKQEVSLQSTLSVSCENSIQLFATNIEHLKLTEIIIKNFNSHPLKKVVCFAPVRYLSIKTLECRQEVQKAIHCNELNWALVADSIDTRYVGIMLPNGGANVHLGVLYFDVHDTVDVVAHEISHLLGFVDEYPLKAEHTTCQTQQNEAFSYNIAVLQRQYQGNRAVIRNKVLKQLAWSKYIKDSTPILQLVPDQSNNNYWQLGTPQAFHQEVGLFIAQTCDNADIHTKASFGAYKGIAQSTQLHYFSLKFPALYSDLLKNNAAEYRMPSFHYNIALAYFKKTNQYKGSIQPEELSSKNLAQANYWLEQASQWEQNSQRSKKIRQGSF